VLELEEAEHVSEAAVAIVVASKRRSKGKITERSGKFVAQVILKPVLCDEERENIYEKDSQQESLPTKLVFRLTSNVCQTHFASLYFIFNFQRIVFCGCDGQT
jgi:hypothetical protein